MENTKNKNNPITTVIIALVIAFLSFFAGTKYQQSKSPSPADFMAQRANGQARGGNQPINGAFRPVNGTILSIDENSLTVELSDGSSKIVMLTDTTQINKATDASMQDLVEGDTVNLFGSQNDDGTITAQTIQVDTMSHFTRDQSN